MSVPLYEFLSYDQLFRMSEPKRVTRSFRVKGPPLEIDSYQDAVYYAFNFKSYPSTTGLRHRGYIKFLRPRNGAQKPLQHLNCVVDCMCPDFKYMWAWANKQRKASRVGPSSLNQAWNQAPRIKNPQSRPGLCKHLLAAREYIYGLLASFPSDEPDTSEKLNKLTQFAQKRWANMPAQMQQARDREARAAAGRAARNAGQTPPTEIPLEEPVFDPTVDDPKSMAAIPPGQRGRNLPAYPKTPDQPKKPAPAKQPKKPAAIKKTEEPKKSIRRIRKGTAPSTPVPKAEKQAADAGFDTTAEYNFRRRQGLGDSLQTNFGGTSVVNANGKDTRMKTVNLNETIALVEELEQDELDAMRAGGTGGDAAVDAPPAESGAPIEAPVDGPVGEPGLDGPVGEPGGDLPPSEPPMSDSAIGADTEGATALGLLRDISQSLKQLSGALVPDQGPEAGGDLPPGEGGAPMEDGPPVEGDGEGEIPVEDPSEEAAAEEGESDDEGGGKPPKSKDDDDDKDDE